MEVGTSTQKTSCLRPCGVGAVQLDIAKGLEAGLVLAAGTPSVRADLLALMPTALPLLQHPLLALPHHPTPWNPVQNPI